MENNSNKKKVHFILFFFFFWNFFEIWFFGAWQPFLNVIMYTTIIKHKKQAICYKQRFFCFLFFQLWIYNFIRLHETGGNEWAKKLRSSLDIDILFGLNTIKDFLHGETKLRLFWICVLGLPPLSISVGIRSIPKPFGVGLV